ncbi:hypothetical protein DOTSEDRAFT_83759 [Dothistroma septosporum NZE10]|uniref:Uncharacterized protein n=1 Tax=Dothistroma septosporum (strain NZE10 / CBS 128990) TaxID=675120 RepID=N1PC24_DOTSN|nr:hypothetical protein DOTSEDRAFT_83759 [Dothistroma septosporum NZE10]
MAWRAIVGRRFQCHLVVPCAVAVFLVSSRDGLTYLPPPSPPPVDTSPRPAILQDATERSILSTRRRRPPTLHQLRAKQRRPTLSATPSPPLRDTHSLIHLLTTFRLNGLLIPSCHLSKSARTTRPLSQHLPSLSHNTTSSKASRRQVIGLAPIVNKQYTQVKGPLFVCYIASSTWAALTAAARATQGRKHILYAAVSRPPPLPWPAFDSFWPFVFRASRCCNYRHSFAKTRHPKRRDDVLEPTIETESVPVLVN